MFFPFSTLYRSANNIQKNADLEAKLAKIDHPKAARDIWKKLSAIASKIHELTKRHNIKACEPLVFEASDLLMKLPRVVTDRQEKYIIENLLIPLIQLLDLSTEHGLLTFSELLIYYKAKNYGLEQILREKGKY